MKCYSNQLSNTSFNLIQFIGTYCHTCAVCGFLNMTMNAHTLVNTDKPVQFLAV